MRFRHWVRMSGGAFALAAVLGLLACERPSTADTVPEGVDGELREYLGGLQQELAATRQQLQLLQGQVAVLEGSLTELRRAATDAGIGLASEIVLDGSAALRGSAEAPIAIVEFTDYQCPYCSRHARETLPRIEAELISTGLVRYVLRDFPITSHKNARPAAIAARCAGEQDRYWEMHAVLFENRKDLGNRLYRRAAKLLGLDSDRFEACLRDPEQGRRVDQDYAYGEQLGVTGTPRFFVGRVDGERVVDLVSINGAMPYHQFAAAVERFRRSGD